jgi:hypothetical protein
MPHSVGFRARRVRRFHCRPTSPYLKRATFPKPGADIPRPVRPILFDFGNNCCVAPTATCRSFAVGNGGSELPDGIPLLNLNLAAGLRANTG